MCRACAMSSEKACAPRPAPTRERPGRPRRRRPSCELCDAFAHRSRLGVAPRREMQMRDGQARGVHDRRVARSRQKCLRPVHTMRTHITHTHGPLTPHASRERLFQFARPTGRACVRHMAHGRPLSRAQRGCSARGRERCEVKHARRRRELCSSRAGGGVYGSRRRVPRPAGLYCCKMPKK